jgi:sugar phosphate isomerase/epimerase
VASPDPAALDIVEKMAKEFNIRVAIHNHGPGDKRYPSPMDVFRMVKDRDARLGICMDVGHTVRIGEDPIEVMKACASRLYDYHLKDVNEATAKGGSAEVGKGVIDIVAVLKTLLDLKFQDHVALEYEANADAPMPGLIESYAFMRGVLATLA